MAGRTTKPSPVPQPANLDQAQLRDAIPLLKRRVDDLASFNSHSDNEVEAMQAKSNDTVSRIYPIGTIEYLRLIVTDLACYPTVIFGDQDTSFRARAHYVAAALAGAKSMFNNEMEILQERLEDHPESSLKRSLRAYEGLQLQREIERAASSRYRSGHYADAVEAAVKALNGLVRLRSGLDVDGSALMQKAFGGETPVLSFNSLSDQSDKDEQKGFMMMFSGAVAGLRNPRAHGFIHDDPERALEFIAFVSLLAKLLDEAN